MAVVLLTIDDDGPKHAVRITDEPAYRDHFLPFCTSLGLRLMSSALAGIRINPSDIASLREEFVRLKYHVAKLWFPKPRWIAKHIPWACEVALSELDAFSAKRSGQLYLVTSYRPQQATGLQPFDHETLMPLGVPIDIRPFVRQLFSLTAIPDWGGINKRCRSFGWKQDDAYPEDSLWFLGDKLRLCTEAGTSSGQAFAFVVLYFFDELGPEMADFCPPGRADYDRAYETSESQVAAVLGDPATRGEYRYPFRSEWPYRYAIWPGEAGVLILRQDELDIQFGMDVNLWVQPWDPATPLPTLPIELKAE